MSSPDNEDEFKTLSGLLMSATNGDMSDKLRAALSTYYVISGSINTVNNLIGRVKDRLVYTVSINSTDPIYYTLHAEILDRISSGRRRALTVKTAANSNKDWDEDDSTFGNGRKRKTRTFAKLRRKSEDVDVDTGAHMQMFFDGSRTETVEIDGHKINIWIERPGVDGVRSSGGSTKMIVRPDRLVFTMYGVKARDALLEFVRDISEAHFREERVAAFWASNRWGDWYRKNDLRPRPLESVVLREGQKERLIKGIRTFLDSEERYTNLGIPWHYGILLEGPPGTGKSSLAQALATHLALDIYYAPLSTLTDDANLMDMVTNVQPGSMLLLEDIDSLPAAQDRDPDGDGDEKANNNKENNLSISGLLNALDGIITPNGLIVVMTTNRANTLDPALIRPGRVDLVEHIGMLDDAQLDGLVKHFVGNYNVPSLNGLKISPAAIVEVLKQYPDPDEAADEISNYITECLKDVHSNNASARR